MSYIENLKKVSNHLIITILIIIIAFFIRFYKFDSIGFWGDEYLTFWLSEPFYSFNYINKKTLDSPDFVPALYYFILNLYNHYFDYSAYFLRLFHIIFGSASLIITYFISKLLLNRSSNNLVLYLLAFNLFLVWSATEVRVVSFALFFQLLSIYIFLLSITNIKKKKIFINNFFLVLSNLISLSIHPLSIVIVISQCLLLIFILLKNKLNIQKKYILYYLICIVATVILYIILNKSYFFNSIETTRLDNHNQLNLNFFLGYNFKHYFSSYILGFINLLVVILTIISSRNKIFENICLFYLFLLFISTYLFIIIGSILLTGMNGQRYWSYLVPIITIMNIYYLTVINRNLISKLFLTILIFYTPFIFFKNLKFPQVKKPDTPELIRQINFSNTYNVVSENYGMFENYLTKGYKNSKIILLKENQIESIENDFWYLCLDLTWHQDKGSYWREMYDCSLKNKNILAFNKVDSIRLQGYVITKYEFKK